MNENILTLLENERNRLQSELSKVEQAIRVIQSPNVAPKVGKRKGKKIKVKDAIITGMNSGKEMDISAIHLAAEKVKGEKINNNTLSLALSQLKKAKAIKNVSRGVYRMAT
jgi:hypothetical protein